MRGYNGTVFAYGQTACGKTYSMTVKYEGSLRRGSEGEDVRVRQCMSCEEVRIFCEGDFVVHLHATA